MAAFGGDQVAFSEAVFGNPGKANPAARPMGNLDRIASDAIRRTGENPTFVTIEKYGRADASVTTFHPAGKGGLAPVTLAYSGATADFERVKPLIGKTPSFGGTAAGIMGPLHFGNFAGMLSKVVWFGLGFAMCYVTFTGLRLWLVRRRERQRSLDWLERAVTVVCFGLPLGLAVSAVGFLVAMPLGTATYWTPAAFLIASAAAIVAGFVARSNQQLDRLLQGATGATLLLLPVVRLANGGPGWVDALGVGQPIIVAIDIAVAAAGAWMLVGLVRSPTRRAPTVAAMQPAE